MMSQAASIIMRRERLRQSRRRLLGTEGLPRDTGRARSPGRAPAHSGQSLALLVALCRLDRGAPSGQTN